MYKVTVSQFIRSKCCNAPVMRQYDYMNDAYPVWCTKCQWLLGSPDKRDFYPGELKFITPEVMERIGKAFADLAETIKGIKIAPWQRMDKA